MDESTVVAVVLAPLGLVAAAGLGLGECVDGAQQFAEGQLLGEQRAMASEGGDHRRLRVAGGRFAGRHRRAQRGQLAAHRVVVDHRRWFGEHPLVDQIPVGLEVVRDAATALLDAETVVLTQLDQAHRGRVVEQHLQEVGEALVELGGALHLVEHVEARR